MAAFIFFLQNSLPACLQDVDRHFNVCQRNNVKGWIPAIKWFSLYGKCGNKCVYAQYIHIYFKHIFKQKFVCLLLELEKCRINSKRGRNRARRSQSLADSWASPAHGAQCHTFIAQLRSHLADRLLNNLNFSPKSCYILMQQLECVCTPSTACANILPFFLYYFYYALSHFKTSLYRLHITHYLNIKVSVCTDLGPNPLCTYAL